MSDKAQAHPTPLLYAVILGILVIGTCLTYWAATQDFGVGNPVIALTIACTKATLVILFFMHVKYSPGLTRLVIVAAFFWLAILIALTLSDVFTRNWTPNPAGWERSLLLDQTGEGPESCSYDFESGNCSATSSRASSRLWTLPSSCASSTV